MKNVLCVAEKPSVSKAITEHLSGGTFETVGNAPAAVGSISGT